MSKVKSAVSVASVPAVKAGQKSKSAVQVAAFIQAHTDKGYVSAPSKDTPSKRAIAKLDVMATPSTGYPQGASPMYIVDTYVGVSATAALHHASLLKVLGGVGSRHAMSTSAVVDALKKAKNPNPRRVVRQATRAGLVAWAAPKA